MLAKYYVITAIQVISTSFGICAGSCTSAGPCLQWSVRSRLFACPCLSVGPCLCAGPCLWACPCLYAGPRMHTGQRRQVLNGTLCLFKIISQLELFTHHCNMCLVGARAVAIIGGFPPLTGPTHVRHEKGAARGQKTLKIYAIPTSLFIFNNFSFLFK